MGLKKIIKQAMKMKAEGNLPEQLIKTVETPFGNIDFLVWPMFEYPMTDFADEPDAISTIKNTNTDDNGVYLRFGVESDFDIAIASPEITKRPDKYEIRISDLTRKEAEDLCGFLEKIIIKI